jgi:hypothetical protein
VVGVAGGVFGQQWQALLGQAESPDNDAWSELIKSEVVGTLSTWPVRDLPSWPHLNGAPDIFESMSDLFGARRGLTSA